MANRKSKRAPESYSRLFETFAGSYVTIAIRSLKGNSRATNKIITNVMLAGYLLDECDDFFYLGENVEEIFVAVRKNDVATIMMGGEDQEFEVPEGTEVQ